MSPWSFRQCDQRNFPCPLYSPRAPQSRDCLTGNSRGHQRRKSSCRNLRWCTGERGMRQIIFILHFNCFKLTVDVMLIKCLANESCCSCRPTTAAGALCPRCSMKIACVAVTTGASALSVYPESNGTLNTKLSGSIECWSTARLYHISSVALLFNSLKWLKLKKEINKWFCSLNVKNEILLRFWRVWWIRNVINPS